MLNLDAPMLLHGIFDFILMYADAKSRVNPSIAGLLVIVFVGFYIYMWRLGLRKIKQHISNDKSFVFKDSTSSEETITSPLILFKRFQYSSLLSAFLLILIPSNI
jgi:hypothetical protein